MEEDIKHIEYILDLYKNNETQKYEPVANLFPKSLKAIENILNELDRLQKENEHINKKYNNILIAFMELLENSIPKSVIEDKLNELKECNTSCLVEQIYNNGKKALCKELLNKGE